MTLIDFEKKGLFKYDFLPQNIMLKLVDVHLKIYHNY